jgi:hypothetical protein
MPAMTVMTAMASRALSMVTGASPDFDQTCSALSVGRRPCLITAALVNLVTSFAPPGALSQQDVGALGASALFLPIWMRARRAPLGAKIGGAVGRIAPVGGAMELAAVQFD